MNRYYQCQLCGEPFTVLSNAEEIRCPSCAGQQFISMPCESPFPKGSLAGLCDVPEEIDETLGEELRDTFKVLMRKMVAGKKDYNDSSLELPISALIDEVDQEFLDVIGWSIIGRRKLNVLRAMVRILEQKLQEMHEKAHPVYVVEADKITPEALEKLEKLDVRPTAIQYYEPGPTWQPIETAPKDGTSVLLYTTGGRAISSWCDDPEGEGAWFGLGGMEPTHWHPLPDPPDASLYQKPKRGPAEA